MRFKMGWRENLGSFDLGRLTLLGWLVFLLSLGAGVGAVVLYMALFDVGLTDESAARQAVKRQMAYAYIAGTIAFFFAAKAALNLAGIRLMLPPAEELPVLKGGAEALQERLGRARKASLFYLLLMPLGFLLPCGISIALVATSNERARELRFLRFLP
jgi:hypothetical protein